MENGLYKNSIKKENLIYEPCFIDYYEFLELCEVFINDFEDLEKFIYIDNDIYYEATKEEIERRIHSKLVNDGEIFEQF